MVHNSVLVDENNKKQIFSSTKNKHHQQQRAAAAAEIIGHSEDLITKISVYLPVKSILRFQSVSKQWHSLLTHPHFIQSYASSSSSNATIRNSMVLFQKNSNPLCQLKGNNDLIIADFGYMPIPKKKKDLFTVDCCNGLLLFKVLDQRVATENWRFYVCNPFTRKYSELSLPDYLSLLSQTLYCYVRLAFDPCSSPYYKVLFFWVDKNGSSDLRLSIYSSDTKTCRLLDCTFANIDPTNYAVYFKGAIFWSDCLFNKTGSSYFDINQVSLKKVPPYSGPSTKDYVKHFARSGGGRLYLILGDNRDSVDLDVYELKEDYSSWVPKYKVHFDAMVVHQYFEGCTNWAAVRYYIPCVLDTKYKEETPRIIIFASNQLLAYNLIDKTMKKLCDVPCTLRDRDLYRVMVIDCTESLSGV